MAAGCPGPAAPRGARPRPARSTTYGTAGAAGRAGSGSVPGGRAPRPLLDHERLRVGVGGEALTAGGVVVGGHERVRPGCEPGEVHADRPGRQLAALLGHAEVLGHDLVAQPDLPLERR